jgi:hypothetical protein
MMVPDFQTFLSLTWNKRARRAPTTEGKAHVASGWLLGHLETNFPTVTTNFQSWNWRSALWTVTYMNSKWMASQYPLEGLSIDNTLARPLCLHFIPRRDHYGRQISSNERRNVPKRRPRSLTVSAVELCPISSRLLPLQATRSSLRPLFEPISVSRKVAEMWPAIWDVDRAN